MTSRIAWPGLALLLAGCASVVTEPPSAMPVAPAGWQGTAVIADTAPPAQPWWRDYGDPQLAALVTAALSANVDVGIATERLAVARGRLAVADASAAPSLRAGADAERARVPRQRSPDLDEAGNLFFSDLPGYTENRRSLGLTLSYELDLFGRVARARVAGQSMAGAAEQDREAIRLLVAREVVLAYTDLRLAQAQAALWRRNRALGERQHQDAAARIGLGLASRATRDAAAAERDQAAQGLSDAQRAAAQAHARLAMLLGRDAAALRLDEEGLRSAPLQVTPDLPATVLARRPDLQSAWLQVEAQRIGVELAMLQRFPRINLTGSAGFASNALGSFLTHDYLSWALGAGVDWLLFDGGRTDAEVATARAEHALALANYRKAMLTALQEVELALADWQHAVQTAALAAAAEQRARRQLADARANLALGRADRSALLDAELALTTAQAHSVDNQAEQWRAYAALSAALGR
ncbi:efflux transporter outer membrane subunit [Chitinolyticbacter albus]|uniref:efflux transporter outer membrane subunit n=1 Tax=Chitinolyticbacter albus TaxID=2961951 RepID=UPI00210EF20B|nr:efflux transporter outer membrane subunit [Chitinolyticbacter albus]